MAGDTLHLIPRKMQEDKPIDVAVDVLRQNGYVYGHTIPNLSLLPTRVYVRPNVVDPKLPGESVALQSHDNAVTVILGKNIAALERGDVAPSYRISSIQAEGRSFREIFVATAMDIGVKLPNEQSIQISHSEAPKKILRS